MSPFVWSGGASLVVLVAGWLVVSFTPPGRLRTLVEWLAATALYGVLVSIFAAGAHHAWNEGNTFVTVALGFLCLLFGAGGCVSLANLFLSLRASRSSEASATN